MSFAYKLHIICFPAFSHLKLQSGLDALPPRGHRFPILFLFVLGEVFVMAYPTLKIWQIHTHAHINPPAVKHVCSYTLVVGVLGVKYVR